MDLRSDLEKSIKDVLSHLDELMVDTLLDFLINQGVKKLQDLRHMTVELLKKVLDHVDASDLHEEWQNAYGKRKTAAGTSAIDEQQPSSSRAPLATLQCNTQQVLNTLPVFDKDSPYMPSSVRKAICSNERPTPSAREDMVGRIVDRCRDAVPNFRRSMFDSIALQIVRDYPASFKDSIPISEHGSDSLARQLKNKFDNDRRPSDRNLTNTEKQAPNLKEAVGCCSWNPSMPEDESEESLTKTMQDLKKMHKISPKNWEWNLIKRKLTSSYYMQRKDINGKLAEAVKSRKPNNKRKRKSNSDDDSDDGDMGSVDLSIVEIQQRWPFLFTAKGINIHFELLTGKNLTSLLSEYTSRYGSMVIEYLSKRNDQLLSMKILASRAEEKGYGGVTLSTLLLMLLKYFDEERRGFSMFIERTITEFEEVSENVQFPPSGTPVLIFAGPNILEYDKIFFSIDQKVLCTATNILEGATLLIASYFVFNYTFCPTTECFLTFIQRAILEICPSKGSKLQDSKTAKKVNNKVLQLANKLKDFDQKYKQDLNSL